MDKDHPAEVAIASTIGALIVEATEKLATKGQHKTSEHDFGFSKGKAVEISVPHGEYMVTMRMSVIAEVVREERVGVTA